GFRTATDVGVWQTFIAMAAIYFVMAFYRPEDQGLIQPRDPSAIAKQSDFGNIFALAIVLLIVAVAFGLYLFAASDSTLPTAAAPPIEQLSPAAPAPATQPQTPTP
ncbi:MAG: hypothetical protein ACXWJV_02115, partial [Hyphomicrobium sp.]